MVFRGSTGGQAVATKVFISYRRDDARADARHLQDRLQRKLGKGNVFMDVDNLRPGEIFEEKLDEALDQADVLLAVIGPDWLELLNERGRAIEVQPDQRDFVREELAAALNRRITVIPVTVDGAELPPESALPQDIRDVVRHQKHNVTHERFGRDVDDLAMAIRDVARRPVNWKPLGVVAAGLAVLAIGAGFYLYMDDPAVEGPELPVARPTPVGETELALSQADWRVIQERLNALGFRNGAMDGVPSASTRGSIGAWQASQRFKVTGYLDRRQHAMLVSGDAAEKRARECGRASGEARGRT